MNAPSKITINLDSLKTRREWKRHKVKDGHNIFRILPPFGDASNGYHYRKWQIIWGLNDPSSGRMRPFASSMTSEKRCPVTEYVKELKAKAETLKAKAQAAGKDEETIKNELSGLNKLISDLSPKTVYIYNAVDKAGEVGLLELKSTAHKKIKAEMLQYVTDYNQDPTSLNSADDDSGVWFDVTRAGLGRDTEYDVKKCQVKAKVNGKLTFEDDRSPLPPNVVENFANLAYDLSGVYQVKSYDDLNEVLQANMANLVELCPLADLSGEAVSIAPAVKTVTKTVTTTGTKPVSIKLDADEEDEEEAPVRHTQGYSAPVAAVKAAAVTEDDDFMAQANSILNS